MDRNRDMPVDRSRPRRVPNNGMYPPKKYNLTHVYFVDELDPNAPGPDIEDAQFALHRDNCNLIRRFFKNYVNCRVHTIIFPPGTDQEAFFAYWTREVRARRAGDLMIVYYHGKAGGEERRYTWKLSHNPAISIKAYDLIEKFNKGAADCLFILDCWIHTRITNKWKRRVGNTEIFARPQLMVDEDGETIAHPKDFTTAIVENLRDFVECIRVDGKRNRTMKSILNIMAPDQGIYSNSQRIWLDRTQLKDKYRKIVKRIKIDPNYVRTTHKIEFWAVQIQGLEIDVMGRWVDADAADDHDEDSEGEDRNDGADTEIDIGDEGVDLEDANGGLFVGQDARLMEIDGQDEADTTDD